METEIWTVYILYILLMLALSLLRNMLPPLASSSLNLQGFNYSATSTSQSASLKQSSTSSSTTVASTSRASTASSIPAKRKAAALTDRSLTTSKSLDTLKENAQLSSSRSIRKGIQSKGKVIEVEDEVEGKLQEDLQLEYHDDSGFVDASDLPPSTKRPALLPDAAQVSLSLSPCAADAVSERSTGTAHRPTC